MSRYCPICNGTECENKFENASNFLTYDCRKVNVKFHLNLSALGDGNPVREFQLKNLIYGHFLYHKDNFQEYTYYFDEAHVVDNNEDPLKVNLADIPYTETFSDRVDRVLMNHYIRCPNPGTSFKPSDQSPRMFFSSGIDGKENDAFAHLMLEIEMLIPDHEERYHISAEGWKRIDEPNRIQRTKKQAFIAMAFRGETKSIREAFRKGIAEAGYIPVAIDEVEHNN